MKNEFIALLRETYRAFSQDKVPQLGAALAYYTAFSLAPLLIIAIAVAGLAFGPEAAQGEIVGQFSSLLGETGAELIQTMIAQAYDPGRGLLASFIGVVTLLLGATGAFNQLQQAMNLIWDVPQKQSQGIMNTIRDRLLSITMVLGTGFLLLTSLLLSAAVAGFSRSISNWLGEGAEVLIIGGNTTITLSLTTVVFALMFKYLPDGEIQVSWWDLFTGAAVTAALFSLGKLLIGLYLGNAALGSSYGAAGSLAILLVWIYYSAQVFFLGAEFTKVFAGAKEESGETKRRRTVHASPKR